VDGQGTIVGFYGVEDEAEGGVRGVGGGGGGGGRGGG